MMKQTEDKEVLGTLHTSLGDYELLSLMPNKRVPWYLKENNIWSFYVMDGYGVAKNIVVSGDFIIEPHPEPKLKPVTFFVEDKEDESKELDDLHEELLESD